jgi:hypothetical protein
MGVNNSKPIYDGYNPSPSPSHGELIKNISETLRDPLNMAYTSDVDSDILSQFKNKLTTNDEHFLNTTEIDSNVIQQFNNDMTNELVKIALPGQTGGKRKPSINKYQKYDVTSYLKKIKKNHNVMDGGYKLANNGFEEFSELEGIQELKKIINSIENENENENENVYQAGGANNQFVIGSVTSPISDGMLKAFENGLGGGGYEEINDEIIKDDLDEIVSDDLDEIVSDADYVTTDNAFSETSAFSNNSLTVSSLSESSFNEMNDVGDINILPFYSSSESSSFQHPYARNRFN